MTLRQSNLTGGVTDADREHRSEYEENWATTLRGLKDVVEEPSSPDSEVGTRLLHVDQVEVEDATTVVSAAMVSPTRVQNARWLALKSAASTVALGLASANSSGT